MVDLEESPIPVCMNQLVSSNQLRGLFGKNISELIPFPENKALSLARALVIGALEVQVSMSDRTALSTPCSCIDTPLSTACASSFHISV